MSPHYRVIRLACRLIHLSIFLGTAVDYCAASTLMITCVLRHQAHFLALWLECYQLDPDPVENIFGSTNLVLGRTNLVLGRTNLVFELINLLRTDQPTSGGIVWRLLFIINKLPSHILFKFLFEFVSQKNIPLRLYPYFR